jgi:uncharacterized membrane protein YcaP (DUF421 family)
MEIVYRALFVFVFLWLITRVVGRSTLGELSTFQLILFITVGDMMQQAVTQQDYSVTGGVLAVSVFTLLTLLLTWVNSSAAPFSSTPGPSWGRRPGSRRGIRARWTRVRSLTHGIAVVVVNRGEPVLDVMKAERLSLDDLMAAARTQGYERFSQITVAVLEANGQMSFFGAKGEGAASQPSIG